MHLSPPITWGMFGDAHNAYSYHTTGVWSLTTRSLRREKECVTLPVQVQENLRASLFFPDQFASEAAIITVATRTHLTSVWFLQGHHPFLAGGHEADVRFVGHRPFIFMPEICGWRWRTEAILCPWAVWLILQRQCVP